MKRRSLLVLLSLFVAVGTVRAQQDVGANNVILLIGDGLGAGQMALGIRYARMVEGDALNLELLMRDGNTGYALASPHESPVTDSAAAASQIATGRRARNETLGMSPSGDPTETILEWAEARGLATGLVTNMRLTHATPAAFAAHQISRYAPESVILDQILLEHDIDVLLGGGARALVPAGRRVAEFLPGIAAELDGDSRRSDDLDRISEAAARGYTIVADRDALARASVDADKLLGLFAASNLPYVVDTRAVGLDGVPSLEDSTSAALAVLARADAGFFLMVEAGRIDYGGHDNDAGAMLHEILDFDAALGAALAFQRTHPQTLVIVTADHGTGGFTFTYSELDGRPAPQVLPNGLTYQPGTRYPERRHLELLGNQSASLLYMLQQAGGSPEQLIETVRQHTGLSMTPEEAREALARDSQGNAWLEGSHFHGDTASNPAALLARTLSRQTFVTWSTGGHTSGPLLTFGRGPGAEGLRGIYDNTHVHEVMESALAAGKAQGMQGVLLEETADTSANASLGDLDGDGDLDIVLAKGRHWPLVDFVLLNDGSGGFERRHEVGGSADRTYTAALADLDGDADLDLVVGNDRPDDKRVYFNDGRGRFRLAGTFGDAGWPTRNVTVADLNGDERPEIIVANRGGPENRSANYLCINDGAGAFPDCRVLSGESATTIAAGDLTGDGRIDLFVPHRDGGQSYLYVNDGAGNFDERHAVGPPRSATRAVVLGDLDGDGLLDIVVGDQIDGGAHLYINRGGAAFAESRPIGDPADDVYALAAADLDGDGDTDVVVGNRAAPGAILTNDGAGGEFSLTRFGDPQGAVYGLAIGDVNGDGVADIVAGRSEAPNILYLGRR